MKTPIERELNKEEFLKKSFMCLMDCGLEKASTRSFSEYTGMKTSSLYYWFENKNELIIDAAVFGLNIFTDKTLETAINNKSDFNVFYIKLEDALKRYSDALKTIVQVASSPHYGKIIRDRITESIEILCKKLAEIMSESLGLDSKEAYAFFSVFIQIIINCSILEQWDKLEKLTEILYSSFKTD